MLVVAAVGFAVYWFWWRKRKSPHSPPKSPPPSSPPPHSNNKTFTKLEHKTNELPKHPTINTSDDDSATSQPAPITKSPSTDDTSNKWTSFKENKTVNLNKFKQDFNVNIKNKIKPEEFSEIMARPCDIDKSLFEIDKIQSFGRKKLTSYDDLVTGISPSTEQIDFNAIDSLEDFDKRGFKNIDDLNVDADQDVKQSGANVELVNSELFGV